MIHPDEIEDVATDIGVSSMLVEHQIKNHRLGTIAEYRAGDDGRDGVARAPV